MSSPLLRLHPQWLARSSSRRPASPRRVRYLTQGPEPAKSSRSPHAQFYSDLVPGMVPVALLGSAVYLGLRLFQSHLSHEKFLDEAKETVTKLETEIEDLQQQLEAQNHGHTPMAVAAPSRRWWFW